MIYLNVPFAQKDQAKSLGARWDPIARKWYIPEELQEQKSQFAQWLTNEMAYTEPTAKTQQPLHKQEPAQQNAFFEQAALSAHQHSVADHNTEVQKGQTLSQFLNRIQQVIWQNFAGGHWIVAEVGSINERRGHQYLELNETDANGRSIANARAVIWKSQAAYLLQKFQQETQMQLCAGQKLLMLCEVQFHSQYGLSLVIQEIDSSFSLGELEQKVRDIRQKLVSEGVYGNNKKLVLSNDFFRIAVIAPPNAAGLGDFQADADKLSRFKLCHFDYFYSSFQGEQVEKEFARAFAEFTQRHQNESYDALVIIRGGGAKLDLHQLNEYSLAKQITEMPIPVLTGIGHERDNTILDEVAHSRFDTPSKVIHYIWQQIQSQAMSAQQNWLRIQRVSQQEIIRLERQSEALWQQVKQQSQYKLNHWKQVTLIPFTRIEQLAQNQISQEKQMLSWLIQQVKQNGEQQVERQKQRLFTLEKEINQQAYSRIRSSKQQMQDWMAMILNAGPKVQIERGFAVISDQEGKTIVSKQQALKQDKLAIQFKDGNITVSVDKNQN
ncbi:exodeoxyribonuclease VII large subunit [Thiomicrorhabdus xiamenensis]|uniref:Exodeoxyribonuclease 7 large subunit n=1 Tax=Thiomicrorhabdus xiamenensis TaxID=2739063 RepID=A0A7D4SSA7_9GAMM|nr:exodeoxyribonuclease VII large subunit [Thiomicrorhabdus xiamenensis]QKI89183.1 exodeoxyribonuclease VII large subunit [Thiomicrorhabdus xiamenensis]